MYLCLSVRLYSSCFGDHSRGPQLHARFYAYENIRKNLGIYEVDSGYVYKNIFIYYPHTGVRRNSVGYSRAYMSVSKSLCSVVHIYFWRQFKWPVIAHSACGRRPRGQTPQVAVYYICLSIILRNPIQYYQCEIPLREYIMIFPL